MRSEAPSLLGRYRLGEEIGGGGMGTVVRAHDEVLGRQVAVKLLRDELASDERCVARFRQEARIAASLSHPGIAAVYDFAEEEGRSAIVMELLDGEDLHTVLERDGPMDPAAAAGIVAESADALSYAHDMGAVHRDVKPANIFLTRSGSVKVTDFGVAFAAGGGQLTTTGALIGTPDYLSPEQVRGERATAASDVYSLGCVAFQLLTGRPPFGGDNSIAIATARLDAAPPSAQALNPEVSDALEAVIAHALSPAPEDRFPSAAAMARALRAAARAPSRTPPLARVAAGPGGPSTVRLDVGPATLVEGTSPVPRPGRGGRDRGRGGAHSPWAWLWVALIAVFLAGLGLDIVRSWQRQNAPRPVPQWTGSTYQDAAAAGTRLGFHIKRTDVSNVATAGQVLGSDPPAGTRLKRGSTVMLKVSLGNLHPLPDVRTENVDDAKANLKGFNVIVSDQTVPGSVDGQVAAQDPAPGTPMPAGGQVTLTVTAVPQPEGDNQSQDNFLSPLLNLFGGASPSPTPPRGKHKGGG